MHSCRWIDPFGFDFDLFTIDREPLKIFLEGSNNDFQGIGAVIEAFGGMISEPSRPGTLIFSHPSHKSQLTGDRYHIEFFKDSIAAQKLQDLEKYRITPDIGQRSRNCDSPKDSTKNSRLNNLQNKLNRSCGDNEKSRENLSSEDDSSESGNVEHEGAIRENGENIDLDIRTEDCSNSIPARTESVENVGRRNNPSLSSSSLSQLADNSTQCSMKTRELADGNRKGKSCQKNQTQSYSEHEDRQIIQVLIATKKIHRAGSIQLWEKFLTDGLLKGSKRSASSLRIHFCYYLLNSYEKYTDDPEALQSFQELKNFISLRRSKRHTYTKQDNLRMMNFLIETNSVHRAGSSKTWEEFLKKENIKDKKPTAISLRAHFFTHLRWNYKKYTKDPVVLRKCRQWTINTKV